MAIGEGGGEGKELHAWSVPNGRDVCTSTFSCATEEELLMQSVQAMVSSPQRGALTYLKNAGLASQNKAHQILKSSYVVSVSAFLFFFTYGLCTSD